MQDVCITLNVLGATLKKKKKGRRGKGKTNMNILFNLMYSNMIIITIATCNQY